MLPGVKISEPQRAQRAQRKHNPLRSSRALRLNFYRYRCTPLMLPDDNSHYKFLAFFRLFRESRCAPLLWREDEFHIPRQRNQHELDGARAITVEPRVIAHVVYPGILCGSIGVA